MSWLTQIFGGSNPITAVANAADRFIRTADEKAEFAKIMLKMQQDFDLKMSEFISARHTADMSSDSWLSKNIRPGICIVSLLLWGISAGLANTAYAFPLEIVKGNEYLMLASVSFYFGSKGFQRWKENSK